MDRYASDFVGDYRPYALRKGHDGVRAMVEGAWTAFSAYHAEVHELIAEGDRVVVHLTIPETQDGQWASADHREARPFVTLQIRDGKVLKQRGIVDNLSALRQLGPAPSPRSGWKVPLFLEVREEVESLCGLKASWPTE